MQVEADLTCLTEAAMNVNGDQLCALSRSTAYSAALTVIWASLLLLLPAWGLQHDLSYEKIPHHLTIEGTSTGAAWTKFSNGEQLTLRYECEPKIGCSTHPSSAVFEFEKGQLISATLEFSRERGPRTREIRDVFQEASKKLGRVVASGRSVGRVLHY